MSKVNESFERILSCVLYDVYLKKLKLILKNTAIDKMLTCASETSTLTKRDRKQFNICERRIYDNEKGNWRTLTLSNPIFLPPLYSPALVYFGRERGWWITCNYPTVLKEKIRNRKSTTCAVCWLKSLLHEEKRREQENHNVRRGPT
jgi:hypothetical protein